MSLSDDLKAIGEESVAKIRRERDNARNELVRLQEDYERAIKALDFIERAEGAALEPPKWMAPAKGKAGSATLMLALSDMHFDEVVNPDEVDGLNAYDRRIAEIRLKRWATNVVKLSRDYLAGVKYDGIVLALLGDTFSGDIHEELSETNDDTALGSLLHWSEQIAAAIDLLTAVSPKIHVVATPGNHGRTTRKPRAKLRAKTNFDWLLAKMVERNYRGNDKITFTIPEGADAWVPVYGQGHLFTHGDQVNGGGGIGGIWPPVMRLRARKAQRYMTMGSSFATLWCGHWHQYTPTPGLVINGSVKGYDEYAFINNFQFEPPQQALAVVVPEKGITFQAPVFCMDRKVERW